MPSSPALPCFSSPFHAPLHSPPPPCPTPLPHPPPPDPSPPPFQPWKPSTAPTAPTLPSCCPRVRGAWASTWPLQTQSSSLTATGTHRTTCRYGLLYWECLLHVSTFATTRVAFTAFCTAAMQVLAQHLGFRHTRHVAMGIPSAPAPVHGACPCIIQRLLYTNALPRASRLVTIVCELTVLSRPTHPPGHAPGASH
jgi:hypothetical protein